MVLAELGQGWQGFPRKQVKASGEAGCCSLAGACSLHSCRLWYSLLVTPKWELGVASLVLMGAGHSGMLLSLLLVFCLVSLLIPRLEAHTRVHICDKFLYYLAPLIVTSPSKIVS